MPTHARRAGRARPDLKARVLDRRPSREHVGDCASEAGQCGRHEAGGMLQVVRGDREECGSGHAPGTSASRATSSWK